MDKEQLIARLMQTFVDELDEHVRALERDLLALERDRDDAGLLNSLSRTAHSLKGAARAVDVGLVERACHRLEEIFARIGDGKVEPDGPRLAVLLETVDALAEVGARLRASAGLEGVALADLVPRLEAISRGAVPPPPAPAREEPRTPDEPREVESPSRPTDAVQAQSVRVATAKLDALLARGGGLLAETRVLERWAEEVEGLREALDRSRSEWRRGERDVRRALASGGKGGQSGERAKIALDALNGRLRDLDRGLAALAASHARGGRALETAVRETEADVRRLRTVAFEETCEGLDRAVRDVARAEGKEVELSIEARGVELDRATSESLRDPLLHLVRNAVSHGIERPAERRAAGKPESGVITISADVLGDFVSVRVADDGRGVSLRDVRERARRLGLPVGDEDGDALRLIFAPGFSTSRSVSEVSGRGIGLDVVASRIEALHGKVDVASRPGAGARFTLTLPLTLGLVRALVVAAGSTVVALPSANIVALRRVSADALKSVEGRDVLPLAGDFVHVTSLSRTLGAREATPVAPAVSDRKLSMVVLASSGRFVAFVVEALLAERAVVVRPFGNRIRRLRHFSGTTVLPDGRLALVLNTAEVVRTASAVRVHAPSLAVASRRGGAVRRRLIVADDSVTTRSLVKSILEAAGFAVIAVPDGAEAWRVLQQDGADLVVTDVQMPRMDGFELTSTIRASDRFRRLPVILVTSLDSEADRRRGVEVGADAYIVKSAFDQEQLLEVIGQLI
jgi:two-component system, chemotaxis family, sensor kinase CheA